MCPTQVKYALHFLYPLIILSIEVCLGIMESLHCQLRARRALTLFKYVPLRTRRALLLYKVYGDSTLLVLNRTALISANALLVLTDMYIVNVLLCG